MWWVRRSAEVLLDGGCDRVLVVVGAAGNEVAALLDDPGWARRDAVVVVRCSDWASGIGASLRVGLGAASAEVLVVHLVDLPDVPAAAVRRVLDRGGSGRAALARATYASRPGHPVLVGAGHVTPLLVTLGGDEGAHTYLRDHDAHLVECGDLASGLDVDG